MNIKINLYSLTLVLFFSFAGHSQTKPPEQSPQPVSQWSAKDTALSLRLRQDGMKYETAHAVLWVEKDGLSRGELEEFGNLVNQGIINIEKFLGAAYNKKRFETDKIEYFLSSEDSPSHTTSKGKPAVFLRLDMVKARRAPYLHETGHLLTSRVEKPQWLEEGFASYLETVVSARYGGYNSYLFNWDKKNIFEFAREELSIEAGKKVLPLVGLNTPWTNQSEEEKEISRAIARDRPVMARAYYTLAESFVTFLGEKIGTKRLIKTIMTPDFEAALRTETGKTTSEWRIAWLNSMTR